MHKDIRRFANEHLIRSLRLCTEPQQLMFKRMYAKGDLTKSIEEVVLGIDDDRMELAQDQVDRTIIKNNQ